jgi:cell division septation protein DedD
MGWDKMKFAFSGSLALGLTGFLAGTGIILATMPAAADVKAGVDAWSRGDYRKAVEQWRPDAIKGDPDAQFNLAQAYKLGRGVPLDMPMAESWFRKAAMQGHSQAEDNYGLVLFDQGKRKDALPWLEKSAGRGEPRAQLVLGTMLFNGDAVAKDWPRAYALIVRSAAAGQPKASGVQAQMDQYIPAGDRQKGLELARQYEDDARRPQFAADTPPRGRPDTPPRGNEVAVRGADVPPSNYGPDSPPPPPVKPGKARPVRTSPPAEVAGDPAPPPPAPRPAPKPVPHPPVAASGGRWQVQLGAFGEPGNARKLWAQAGGRFPGAGVTFAQAGKLTKVLVGPYASRGAAVAACGAVKPCVPVAN